jgi:uncharacterized membrane protein
MKQPQTKEQYIEQLQTALKKYNVKDIADIIEDYEEYFAHSKTKGYSVAESIHRLPSAQELARSYEDGTDGKGAKAAQEEGQVSRTGRTSLFVMMILGELLLLPFLAVAGLFFICIGVAGLAAIVGGVLVLAPQDVLGDMTVPHPPVWQVLPTMTLLIAGGVAVFGTTLVIAERFYSALRASLLMKKWMLTGRHGNHLRLVPPLSKRVRQILYTGVLLAGLTALMALLVLTIVSLVTTNSPDFIRSWNA